MLAALVVTLLAAMQCEDCMEALDCCCCELQPPWGGAASCSAAPAGMPESDSEDENMTEKEPLEPTPSESLDGRGKYDRSSGNASQPWGGAASGSAVPAGMPVSDSEDENTAEKEPLESTPRERRDGRGKYDRSSGKGTRQAWKPYVQKHMQIACSGNVSSWLADEKRMCGKDCPQGGSCIEAVGNVRTLKVCAAESFGDAALLQDWESITPNHGAVAQWFQLAHSGRLVDPAGNVTDIIYKVPAPADLPAPAPADPCTA